MTDLAHAPMEKVLEARDLLRDLLSQGVTPTAIATEINYNKATLIKHAASDIPMSNSVVNKIMSLDEQAMLDKRTWSADSILPLIEAYLDDYPETWSSLGRRAGLTGLKHRKSLSGNQIRAILMIVAPGTTLEHHVEPYSRKAPPQVKKRKQLKTSAWPDMDLEQLALDMIACEKSFGVDIAFEAGVERKMLDMAVALLSNGGELPEWLVDPIARLVPPPGPYSLPTPTGTRRRVQALYRWGYGASAISGETTLPVRLIDDIAMKTGWMDTDLVTRQIIKRAFERLEMTPGGRRLDIAEWAKWRGFPLPLQWDEDDIDNPRGRVNPKTDRSNNEENAA